MLIRPKDDYQHCFQLMTVTSWDIPVEYYRRMSAKQSSDLFTFQDVLGNLSDAIWEVVFWLLIT